MSRLRGARAILDRMMREIARDDVPTPETWAAGCRLLGWPEPPPFEPGEPVSVFGPAGPFALSSPQQFKPACGHAADGKTWP